MSNLPVAQFTLTLCRTQSGHNLNLRFAAAGGEPARELTVPVALDLAALRALADLAVYSETLTTQLWADPSARAFALKALADMPCWVQLQLAPAAAELHTLRWELLAHPVTGQRLLTKKIEGEQRWEGMLERATIVQGPQTNIAGGSQNQVFSGEFHAPVYMGDIYQITAAEIKSPAPGEPPYKGLAAFTEEDADHFFGRADEVQQLKTRVELLATANTGRFLAVVGASGSGKSSLVQAGLIPVLKQTGQWAVGPVYRPQALSAQLDTLATLIPTWQAEAPEAQQVLLVVDQFEEVFTQTPNPTHLMDALLQLAQAPTPVTVMVLLRADFFTVCLQHAALRQALENRQFLLGAMSRSALAQAITRPAAQGLWEFEPGLVEKMLDEVGAEPGHLPLLSQALLETWHKRAGRRLTLQGYTEAGGVEKALANRAQAVYDALLPTQQAVARHIFVQLTHLGEGLTPAPDTRRRVRVKQLPTQAYPLAEVQAVLQALTAARLVVADQGPNETLVEVAHEALIRAWPSLRAWLAADREAERLRRRLEAEAQAWDNAGREVGLLYRAGVKLAQAEEWLAAAPARKTDLIEAFVRASRAEVEREALAQHQRELVLTRQRAQMRLAFGLGSVILLLALVAFYFAFQSEGQKTLALTAEHNAQVARITAESASTKAVAEQRTARVAQATAEAQSTNADIAKNQAKVAQAKAQAAAEALNQLAQLYQALEEEPAAGQTLTTAQTLQNIGAVYLGQAQFAEAQSYFQRALVLHNATDAQTAATLYGLGEAQRGLRQYVAATKSFTQAVSLQQALGDFAGVGQALNGLGAVAQAQEQYVQAQAYFTQALPLNQRAGDEAGEAQAWLGLGAALQAQEQYALAQGYFAQALTLTQRLGNRLDEAQALIGWGGAAQRLGQHAQALNALQQALTIARAEASVREQSAALFELGTVAQAQGQYALALDYFNQAVSLQHSANETGAEGRTLNQLGWVYADQEQWAEAGHYAQQSLTLARQTEEAAGEGAALTLLGAVYRAQGQWATAIEALQQARVLQQQQGARQAEAQTLNLLGQVYADQGQTAQAVAAYAQALAIFQALGDPVGIGNTLNNLGAADEAQGELAQALEYYRQAMAALEGVRANASNDLARAHWLTQYAGLYRRAAWVAYQLGDNSAAFTFSEQGRARAFLDALSTGTVLLSDAAAQTLMAQEQATYTALEAVRLELQQARAQSLPDAKRIAELTQQLAAAEAAHAAAVSAIAARKDELAALVPGRAAVLTLAEVQALLDDQTTLIAYFVIDDVVGALAFIITRNTFDVVALPRATPTFLTAQAQALSEWPNLAEAYPQPLRDLHAALMAPLQTYLKTPRLGLIPHLTLHDLPFAALTNGQTYLGQQFQLFALPSASSLRFIQQHAQAVRGSGAVVLGNAASHVPDKLPLIYAEAEAQRVAELLGVSPRLQTEATELYLRQAVSGTRVLHIAAHGEYNPYNPLYSALYLAPDVGQQFDGRLEGFEIFGLPLAGVDLVALSAGETQVGQRDSGDERVDLARAFMFAGAPSVLASLWAVDDAATRALMVAFYQHWQVEGLNKAQALQAAQAEVRANPKWQSPYYWAAFVLNGDVGQAPAAPTP